MNIFYLDNDPTKCAEYHLDKHVVKMILEYALLLSTAQRILDGKEVQGVSKSGRKAKRWELPDERDAALYKASHMNHPSAKWARHSACNYRWLFKLWIELMREYNYRYGKIHASARLIPFLKQPPKNIQENGFSAPWRAMPDEYKVEHSVVQSYRNYYIGAKAEFAKWTKRETPEWFINKEELCN